MAVKVTHFSGSLADAIACHFGITQGCAYIELGDIWAKMV
jgi:hypothetical protein